MSKKIVWGLRCLCIFHESAATGPGAYRLAVTPPVGQRAGYFFRATEPHRPEMQVSGIEASQDQIVMFGLQWPHQVDGAGGTSKIAMYLSNQRETPAGGRPGFQAEATGGRVAASPSEDGRISSPIN
jgi:hypothetical protein